MKAALQEEADAANCSTGASVVAASIDSVTNDASLTSEQRQKKIDAIIAADSVENMEGAPSVALESTAATLSTTEKSVKSHQSLEELLEESRAEDKAERAAKKAADEEAKAMAEEADRLKRIAVAE
jgi:hypothetical protein